MTLGWSRAMYAEFTVCADMAWWLRCHVHAFHCLGGVPRRVLHDNLKIAVLTREPNGTVHWPPPLPGRGGLLRLSVARCV